MTSLSVSDADQSRPVGALTADDLPTVLADHPDLVLLDVRTPGEYAAGHIPGSLNLPLASLGECDDHLTSLDCSLVLVCQSGARAAQAQTRLAELGASNTIVLTDGITGWAARSGEIKTVPTTTWPLERQIRLVAGGLTLAGVVASLAVPKAKFLAGGVGFGLTFSALTNTCAMGNLLSRLPYNRPTSGDVSSTLAELNGRSRRTETEGEDNTDHDRNARTSS